MEKSEMEPEQRSGNDIGITERAFAEIQRIKTENDIPDTHGLRVGVKGGGCSGFSYFLGFDEKRSETDTVMTVNGISVIIDAQSRDILSGAELDFHSDEAGKGFIVNNPNANHDCGCGHSSCG
jgi:iron-sulfur cluster assembly protein